ncbi:MFS transporter [Natronolimnohabitans sp. A-GB9]|uniref:MFS transporter n=1 Tax=Natronolimnohabitans sp. A-GB9 TaxID=3069757 RepID=UPI0027B13C28|nr:MFS transporter [Natronolimnohabitans sp. A-GB9]MDQ2050493.1 MFS transporter [Natronolimnohabitans sp. A-GB9]
MERTYGIEYGPHLAAFSVGYVLFSYASVPGAVVGQFDVGYTAVGLLMSAALAAFVIVQPLGGRFVDGRSTVPVLLGIVCASSVLAVVMDLVDSFGSLLALRALWGLAGGLAVTVCATQISRVYTGPRATWHQGLNGGMFTAGGAVAYLVTPSVVDSTGWFGVHAVGALVAVPAGVVLWLDSDRADRTRPVTESVDSNPQRRTDGGTTPSTLAVLRSPTVLLAAACNFATLGGYVTLSTFVAAYFADLGLAGPLSALALFVASLGRLGGGIAVLRPSVPDGRVIAGAASVGAASLFVLLVADGVALVALPLLALAAVSLPFGAIFKTASTAAGRDGTAVAFVVASGNVAALLLPAITGHLRDATGEYTLAFALIGLLNLVAAVAGIAIARRR